MVASVIYGLVNFWNAAFVLPKAFYAKVDALCVVFLWKNSTSSAAGSRVAWKEVCLPKSEGGLGIRLLEDFQLVFSLKRAWHYFSKPDSLWVSWLSSNIFHRTNFWLMQESPRLSSTIRNMLQLRPMLKDYMRCLIRDGTTASFWFDTWTELGQMISVIGENGPRDLRIHKAIQSPRQQ